ncbi:MAG: DUF3572 domain-containing protein [Pseudomonadota bacterium]
MSGAGRQKHPNSSAEAVALQALAWLLSDARLQAGFLAQSGADAQALRRGATDPVFLGFVLDYLLMSDDHIVDFCDMAGLDYDAPARARHALPGGADAF